MTSNNIENQINRLEDRVENLSNTLTTYQNSNLQLIHQIDKKVESHASVFRVAQWLIPGGSLLALLSFLHGFVPIK